MFDTRLGEITVFWNLPFSARITRAEAEGTTATAACRFWIVSWTVTRSPFHADVAFAISSPTFFGDYDLHSATDTLVLFGRPYQTERTDFGSQCRRSTDFTSRCPQVDDLDFIGILDTK